MMPYNEDAAWTRVQDLQREMENSQMWAERTMDVLGLFARPLVALVEMAALAFRPLPPARRLDDFDSEAGSDAA
jgi:hypothetical protein